jgi:hypothetical protein
LPDFFPHTGWLLLNRRINASRATEKNKPVGVASKPYLIIITIDRRAGRDAAGKRRGTAVHGTGTRASTGRPSAVRPPVE